MTTTRVSGATAGEGAAAQEGTLPVYTCGDCHHEVVWATSSRTGRKYLVNVTRGYHDQRFYMKRNAHTRKRCAENIRYAAELDAYFAGTRT